MSSPRMSRETASRYRVTFSKTVEMRYTSHLDLQRTWERLMRRAELPLLFTEGFHPRVRFNLAAALPLGFTGDAEICDLYLTERIEPAALCERLRRSAPPGVDVRSLCEVPSLGPAVQTLIRSADYVVDADDVDADAVVARVEALLAARELPRERRGKVYDLRPLVESLSTERVGMGVRIRATLSCRPGATGRPDELLDALGLEPLAARVCRTRLVLDDEPGEGAEISRTESAGA